MDFIGLGTFEGFWQLKGDGEVMDAGKVPRLDLAPTDSRTVRIPLPAIEPQPGVEYWLDLSFRLAEELAVGGGGSRGAWEQFKLDLEGSRTGHERGRRGATQC